MISPIISERASYEGLIQLILVVGLTAYSIDYLTPTVPHSIYIGQDEEVRQPATELNLLPTQEARNNTCHNAAFTLSIYTILHILPPHTSSTTG